MEATLWAQGSSSLEPHPLAGPMPLGGGPAKTRGSDLPVVFPVAGVTGVVAVALVAPGSEVAVSHNGVPIPSGVIPLHHADRLDANGRTFWVSISARPAHSQYQPAHHGKDVFCFITKARLKAADEITICGGRPEKPCGMIYRRAAWEMACESAAFKCPNCQFDPRQPPWEPPAQKPAAKLDDLFRLLSGGAAT